MSTTTNAAQPYTIEKLQGVLAPYNKDLQVAFDFGNIFVGGLEQRIDGGVCLYMKLSGGLFDDLEPVMTVGMLLELLQEALQRVLPSAVSPTPPGPSRPTGLVWATLSGTSFVAGVVDEPGKLILLTRHVRELD